MMRLSGASGATPPRASRIPRAAVAIVVVGSVSAAALAFREARSARAVPTAGGAPHGVGPATPEGVPQPRAAADAHVSTAPTERHAADGEEFVHGPVWEEPDPEALAVDTLPAPATPRRRRTAADGDAHLPPIVSAVRSPAKTPGERRARMIAAITSSGPVGARERQKGVAAFDALLEALPATGGPSRRGDVRCHRAGCTLDLVFADEAGARNAQHATTRALGLAADSAPWSGERAYTPVDLRADGAHVTWILLHDGA